MSKAVRAQRPHSSDVAEARRGAHSGGMPVRLLIVDDRPRTRRAVRALLAAHAGFDVVGEASDGEQALERVAELRPELVLLDVRMPRLDGIAATAEIKTRWPGIRVVVHSLATERQQDALAA